MSEDNIKISPDLFDRKTESENLTSILKLAIEKNSILKSSSGVTINVDGQWGSGKTFFLNHWEDSLPKNDYFIVKLDAWKTDFSKNPFIALTSELHDAIKNSGLTSEAEEFRDKAKGTLSKIYDAATIFTRCYIENIVDAEISEILEDAGLGEAGEKALSATKASSRKNKSDALNDFSDTKMAMDSFRDSLIKIVKSIRKSRENDNCNLVFIIDELDRCRPTYAIELLESVKHFFQIDGIAFIFATDKNQLIQAIKSVYGTNFDSRKYLRRFFSYDLSLSKPNFSRYVEQRLVNFPMIDMDRMFLAEDHFGRLTNIEILSDILESLGQTARDVSQILSILEICFFRLPKSEIHGLFLIPLIVIFREISVTAEDLRIQDRDALQESALEKVLINSGCSDKFRRKKFQVGSSTGGEDVKVSYLDIYQMYDKLKITTYSQIKNGTWPSMLARDITNRIYALSGINAHSIHISSGDTIKTAIDSYIDLVAGFNSITAKLT